MADHIIPVDEAAITSSIGSPQHTSTPLPKRRAVPSLTIPVPDTNHHVRTLSSLHPMSSPSYLQPPCMSSPYSFFPSCTAMNYTHSFGQGVCTGSSYTIPPPSTFNPQSPCFLPSLVTSTYPVGSSSIPAFLPPMQQRTSSYSVAFQEMLVPTLQSPSVQGVTPPLQLPRLVYNSPVRETHPLDFKLQDSKTDIGKAVDDIISKTLGTDPKTKTTNSLSFDLQSALEDRLQSLQSKFPTEVKELSSFLAFHSSSIQKEHQQCLQDGFFPTDYHNWLTNRYNDQLHLVFTSIERSVNTLENQGKMMAGRNLSPEATALMEKWYLEHLNNPYPTRTEAEDMANKGGITLSQLRKWFANKRHRTRKPRSVKGVLAAKQCEEFLSGIFQM